MVSTARIRELNDAFRTTFIGNGDVYLTRGVAALPGMEQSAIIERVQTFEDFTPENDPYYEHDFGSFRLCGRRFFWKIDYYDCAMEHGSENQSDPEQTTRVLTIMLASEY